MQGTKIVEAYGSRQYLSLAEKKLEERINEAIQELAKENKTIVNVTHNGILKQGGGAVWTASATILWECDEESYMKYNKASSSSSSSQNSSSGCYVATAVYGSYDCPEVWTLRRYRDYTLAETWYGRAFIKVYYAISPTIVKWFGDTSWFKHMWQGKLDSMVKKLNEQGVENTPYKDRDY